MRCFPSLASRLDRICVSDHYWGRDWSPLLLAGLLIAGAAISAPAETHHEPAHGSRIGPRVTSQLAGSVATHDGGRLHLVTKLGNVVIRTSNSGKVDFSVQLEADASQRDAKTLLKDFRVYAREASDGVYIRGVTDGEECSGRLWVTINVNVPRNYTLDVSTGGGNIEADDIDGRVALITAGGNISAGSIGGSARLESESGGHISVKNVSGDLTATTGGGHITTGSIAGNATLRTTGGHIRVASVEGVAHLETGGGNVTLQHSGTELIAETTGGQIEVGEAAGLVRAKTGGGGIRVVRVSGPTNLQTAGGSIYLTQVDSSVKASASAGGITAWFVSTPKGQGSCELESNDGDIVVYLPRQIPVTIDAKIQMGDDHRVIVDPAFPLKVSYDDGSHGARMVRAEGALNGGGEVIRLRTVAGNIHLALSDSNKQLQLYKLQMEQLQRKLESQLRLLEQTVPATDDQPRP
jgi:Putative adhesin